MGERQGRDMRLKITSCRQVYTGRNAKGDAYTIFEIGASRNGQPINEKLRSFTPFPIDAEVDVTVTPFESERHGRSFTLHPKGQDSKPSTQQQLNELREFTSELQQRVAALMGRMADLEARVGSNVMQPPAAPPQASSTALGAQFGEDAPW